LKRIDLIVLAIGSFIIISRSSVKMLMLGLNTVGEKLHSLIDRRMATMVAFSVLNLTKLTL
jgi:hypothetical protein